MSAPVTKGEVGFVRYAAACPFRYAIRVDAGKTEQRCRRIVVGNGPSALCSRAACPLRPDHCESCGNMETTHLMYPGRKPPGCAGFTRG